MSRNSNRSKSKRQSAAQDILPEPKMSDMDFTASERLLLALKGRSTVEGYTIDPPGTHIIDDGLSIKRSEQGWKIIVSIVDLPSIIPDGSRLEKMASVLLKEEFANRRTRRIWPSDFLDKYASMIANTKRPAISFKIHLDRDYSITHSEIARTIFSNRGEHADGAFKSDKDFCEKRKRDWCELAHGLYRKRCNDLAGDFDRVIDASAENQNGVLTDPDGGMKDGKLLIHEVMRLTSRVAAEYVQVNSLIVPFKPQKIFINPALVTPDYGFDATCNKLCADLTQRMAYDGLPYVHINSPMRRYQDYLALKVLGRHLAGLPVDVQVRNEICGLKEAFNRLAGNQDRLLAPQWNKDWRQQLRAQQGWNPLDNIAAGNERLKDALALKQVCKEQDALRPLIAERELMVQGTVLYFTGIDLRRESARDLSGWAVAAHRGASLNLAARRIMRQIEAQPQSQLQDALTL
jgi:hypothetical protein